MSLEVEKPKERSSRLDLDKRPYQLVVTAVSGLRDASKEAPCSPNRPGRSKIEPRIPRGSSGSFYSQQAFLSVFDRRRLARETVQSVVEKGCV